MKKPLIDLIGQIVDECDAAGISVKLLQKETYQNSRAIFDADNNQLVVCMKNEEWPYYLLHEYMHFCQWRDDSKAWLELFSNADQSIYTLRKQDYKSNAARLRHFQAALKVEIDCDKKCLSYIRCYPELAECIEIDFRGINCYWIQFYFYHKYMAELNVAENSKITKEIYEKIPENRFLEFDEAWQYRKELDQVFKAAKNNMSLSFFC